MKIKWNDTWLADDVSPSFGLTFNGQQIVQEAQFIAAANAALYGRGNRTLAIAFSVTRTFGTVRAAEVYALTVYDAMADEGTLVCRCGALGEGYIEVEFEDAVLVGRGIPRYRGVTVQVDYQFRAPKVSTIGEQVGEDDLPPDEVPPEIPPDDDEDDDMKSASVNIPAGVDQFSVGIAFPSIPARVLPHVRIPAGGEIIHAHVVDGTLDGSGFDVSLSGVTPNGDYILDFAYQL